MFKFGRKSNERLNTTNIDMQMVARRALSICPIDFGVPADGGFRTAERQYEMFLDPDIETGCDGYKNPSYHQTGKALDVYAFVDGKANWEPLNLAIIATAMLQAACEYGVKLEWGGLWKKPDRPHFQIVE